MKQVRKKVAFHTLGCKLNFAESSSIASSLPGDQFEMAAAGEKADVYIINTCSVTDAADRKCRQAIKKFIHQSPGSFIAVVGCYAQLKPQDVSAIPGVDLVLGSNEKFDLAAYIAGAEKKKRAEIHIRELSDEDTFHTSYSTTGRTRSFLKIQDGCDYGCSYCTIPLARGRSRNPSITLLAEEAREIAAKGIKEIVLTGVNTGDFGKSTGENFCDLLSAISKTEGLERIRLTSIEPNLLTDRIIELVAGSRTILPHFHIPLQSGNDRILGLMRRRYTRDTFADRVNKIREIIPLAGIGADVITGFPGENEADFEVTYDFIESCALSYLHVFSYSDRPGTHAYGMPLKVPPPEKEIRSKRLSMLSADKHNLFCNKNLGQTAEVLFEQSHTRNLNTGFTGNYIRVEHKGKRISPGEIRKVKLTGISGTGNMTCELIYTK
jgi:threonylcarbamoyladenosine tRNA methylthiotransferase MtaB